MNMFMVGQHYKDSMGRVWRIEFVSDTGYDIRRVMKSGKVSNQKYYESFLNAEHHNYPVVSAP